MIQAGCGFGFPPETYQRLVRICVITEHPLYGNDPPGVSLPGAINHAHAAPPDLLEDFVIAEVPLLVWHVDFSEDTFKNCARHLAWGAKSLAQEAADANSGTESSCRAAQCAFCGGLVHARARVRESIRILHYT